MLPLPVFLVDSLRAHRVGQLEDRIGAGPMWQESGLVFTSSTGRPLDERNVTRVFERLLTAAELPRVRFHDLRHSCASLLLAQGIPPRVVMEILDHSQISITMDTYSHVIPALAQDAVDSGRRGARGLGFELRLARALPRSRTAAPGERCSP
ncbi:MAG: site-specific integrase [Chloroflexota bacterium]|nr:MAG: site-specific integrase [Chloroflexota bacterium]